MNEKAYLVLSDGTVYEGVAFGCCADSVGELVFTTGMCGYIETLTDESYYGQIVMQTFPLIGNYGIIEDDFEGICSVKGYVVSEVCASPSNFRCGGTLDSFLKANGIPGICGIDTRAVTKKIREHGVMNAMICQKVPDDLTAIQGFVITDALSAVTCSAPETYKAKNSRFSVTLLDYGAKRNIIRELLCRGCDVTVVPASTCCEDILGSCPDGVMLSNGPGDPADNIYEIAQIKGMLGKVPMFGICLGHQMLAIAAGGATEKLRYGHRGANQPVFECKSGRTYITSQNHGYSVVSDSLTEGILSFYNANDKTCEGIDYPDNYAFSVQFHPEASSGPHDTAFLFDRFVKLMEDNNAEKY